MSKLVIALLNWNGYDLTRACLESLASLEAPPHRILIVDNGSTEEEAMRLAEEFGGPVEALTLEENLGVGGGYNAAISRAKALAASHVLLLNNDTLVTDPMMAARLVEACGPGVFAVGPRVLDATGRLFSAGGRVDWSTAEASHLQSADVPVKGAPYDVAWIDGSCMMVSVDAACRLGGFSEEFFLYWEEVDMCVRARKAGYRCLVEPRTTIVHLGSQTVRHTHMHHLMLRNTVLFMRRNASSRRNTAFVGRLLFWLVPRFMYRRTKGRANVAETGAIIVRAVAWNISDAWRKRAWRSAADGSLDCRATDR